MLNNTPGPKKQVARQGMHAANVEKSDRLRRILNFLRERGNGGATGKEIIKHCDVTGLEGVRELRKQGYVISVKRERVGTSVRWRYILVSEPQSEASAGHADAEKSGDMDHAST